MSKDKTKEFIGHHILSIGEEPQDPKFIDLMSPYGVLNPIDFLVFVDTPQMRVTLDSYDASSKLATLNFEFTGLQERKGVLTKIIIYYTTSGQEIDDTLIQTLDILKELPVLFNQNTLNAKAKISIVAQQSTFSFYAVYLDAYNRPAKSGNNLLISKVINFLITVPSFNSLQEVSGLTLTQPVFTAEDVDGMGYATMVSTKETTLMFTWDDRQAKEYHLYKFTSIYGKRPSLLSPLLSDARDPNGTWSLIGKYVDNKATITADRNTIVGFWIGGIDPAPINPNLDVIYKDGWVGMISIEKINHTLVFIENPGLLLTELNKYDVDINKTESSVVEFTISNIRIKSGNIGFIEVFYKSTKVDEEWKFLGEHTVPYDPAIWNNIVFTLPVNLREKPDTMEFMCKIYNPDKDLGYDLYNIPAEITNTLTLYGVPEYKKYIKVKNLKAFDSSGEMTGLDSDSKYVDLVWDEYREIDYTDYESGVDQNIITTEDCAGNTITLTREQIQVIDGYVVFMYVDNGKTGPTNDFPITESTDDGAWMFVGETSKPNMKVEVPDNKDFYFWVGARHSASKDYVLDIYRRQFIPFSIAGEAKL